jgi:hypothetical protein
MPTLSAAMGGPHLSTVRSLSDLDPGARRERRVAWAALLAELLVGVQVVTGDEGSDALAGPYLTAGTPADAARWDPPNTGHAQALATHPVEWEERVIGFFDAALRPAGE